VTRDSTWFRYDAPARRFSVTLHVQPNARKSEIVALHGDALKVRIAAPAADNRANAALIVFLSETLGVQRSAMTIRHGATGRRKVVEFEGGPELVTRLKQFAND
jgi:uncharacterized protein (TIGR00251 family)